MILNQLLFFIDVYDKADKKMCRKKEISFSDSDVNTLNYKIRILGLRGF